MAAALEQACKEQESFCAKTRALRARFIEGISQIEGAHVLGPTEDDLCLPGIVGFCLEGINREAALVLLDEAGLCMSAGSACAAGAVEESATLAAMGVPAELARGYLRASIDAHENKAEQIDEAVSIISSVAARLRAATTNATLAGNTTHTESTPHAEGSHE